MPKSRTRTHQQRREQNEQKRRQQADQTRAEQTQKAQAEAADRRRRYLRWRHRKIAAGTLFALAVIVAGTHMLEHLGAFQVMTPGLQDLLIGYPTAAVLAVVAAIVAGTK